MIDKKKVENIQQSLPTVSVIVPVYNVEKYLAKCIDSIINQSYNDLEILLVNDGSMDSSGSICDFYASKDNRIKVMHQSNAGQSVARNTGLQNATGELISFIDSDDWIELDMYENMVFAMTNNQLDVVECEIMSTLETKERDRSDIPFRIESPAETMQRVIDGVYFSVCRRIYTKEILKNLTFVPNRLYEDLLFTIQVINRIDKMGFVIFPFYNYFVERPDSTIRSAYNQKKLNSIDAGIYVVANTQNYNISIKSSAVNFMILFLIEHYNSLFENPQLDKDFIHRKHIRKTVQKHFRDGPFSFYGLMLKILPFRVYRIFLALNSFRIKIQNKLFSN